MKVITIFSLIRLIRLKLSKTEEINNNWQLIFNKKIIMSLKVIRSLEVRKIKE